MELETGEFREYALLVYVPHNYSPEDANEAKPKWNRLLDEWKANGTFVASYVYPNVGHLVRGLEKSVNREAVACGDLKLVSHLIVRAAHYNAAVERAKGCPVLEQGGTIEVREVRARPIPDDLLKAQASAKNRMLIRHLYEDILNTGRLDLLKNLISDDYQGVLGEKGARGFAETIHAIRSGFPDIRWTIEDLMAEGNKVMLRWSWKGTNKGSFRGIPASHKEVVDRAIAIYEFSGDRISKSWLQSDRLGLLQQIGHIPKAIITTTEQ